MRLRRPLPAVQGDTLHIVGVGDNRIGKEKSSISRIIDEINADLMAYGKEYENVMFVVYDNGAIGNVDEFKRDIESSGKSRVLVVKN